MRKHMELMPVTGNDYLNEFKLSFESNTLITI